MVRVANRLAFRVRIAAPSKIRSTYAKEWGFIKVFVSKPKIQKYMNIREKYRHAYTEVGVVTKNLSYRVSTTSRLGIKQLGVSFGSIFLLFSFESSWRPRSW